jgi:hypothetical protein
MISLVWMFTVGCVRVCVTVSDLKVPDLQSTVVVGEAEGKADCQQLRIYR